MAIFYIEGEVAYTNKATAMVAARESANAGHHSYVKRITTPAHMSIRELLVRTFNREGFAAEQVTIAEFEPRD
jgi:hypothetical protein